MRGRSLPVVGARALGRTVLVSNRVALPGETQTGGLAVALSTAMEDHPALWLGWSGRLSSGTQSSLDRPSLDVTRVRELDYALLDLPADDFDDYYHGFANRVLWPLFHYRIDLVDYHREQQDAYLRINRHFANALVRQLRADDVIWVHDYHLIPLARCLRELGVDNRIGFFLHVPLPPPDVLDTLPAHETLLGALVSYDLVGFQTRSDLANFRQYLQQHHISPRTAHRSCHSDAFPIGIDVDAIATIAKGDEARVAGHDLRASLSGRKLAIGVDRLDYSKGLPERFKAFERHLEGSGQNASQLTYLQIAPPSRTRVPEYRSLRRELEGLAGHINGRHAKPDWTPIRYVNDSFPQAVLTGFYRAADIALITPLRDGMNLVAKEYLASQSPQNPGTLVLSRFAGAAEVLEQALLVNPHDIDEMADAIGTAAAMPLSERQDRWHAMMETLRSNDVSHWARRFLTALRQPQREVSPEIVLSEPLQDHGARLSIAGGAE